MNQDALKAFRYANLIKKDYEIFFAILEILDFGNYLQLCQKHLCKKLNMQLLHINRSVKKIISIDALVEGPKISCSRTYRLNPNFGWKGSAKSHQIALKQGRNSLCAKAK